MQQKPEHSPSIQNNLQQEGIIVPPGCDNPMLHECGESVYTYIPEDETVKPCETTLTTRTFMSGKSKALSVPKTKYSMATKHMTDFLLEFQGAYICIDFWTKNHTKIKKCGILCDVGKNCVVLQNPETKSVTIIDLEPIYYIQIYCK